MADRFSWFPRIDRLLAARMQPYDNMGRESKARNSNHFNSAPGDSLERYSFAIKVSQRK
jgi:hypothetical protein